MDRSDEYVEKNEELKPQVVNRGTVGFEEGMDPFAARVPRQASRCKREIAVGIGDSGKTEIDEAAHLTSVEEEVRQRSVTVSEDRASGARSQRVQLLEQLARRPSMVVSGEVTGLKNALAHPLLCYLQKAVDGGGEGAIRRRYGVYRPQAMGKELNKPRTIPVDAIIASVFARQLRHQEVIRVTLAGDADHFRNRKLVLQPSEPPFLRDELGSDLEHQRGAAWFAQRYNSGRGLSAGQFA